jgi:hypothetical protein
MYFELFIAAALLCLGQIVFGRFGEGVPKSQRILKMAVFLGVTALLSRFAGRAAALGWIFGLAALGMAVHGWWTHKHGIRFSEPEPWDRYRALRGWS